MDSHTTQLELLALTADLEAYINAKLRHLRKLILSSQVEVQVKPDNLHQNGCLLPAQSSSLDTQPSSSSLNVNSSSSSSTSSTSTSASSSSLTEVQPPVALIKPPVAPTSAQAVPVTELTFLHNQAVQEVPKKQQQQQQQDSGPSSSLKPKEAINFNVRAFIAAERLTESGNFSFRLSIANLPSLLKVGEPSPTRFHVIHIASVSHFVLVAEGVTEQLVTDMSRFYRANTSECTFKDDETQAGHLKPGSLVVFALGRSTSFFFRGLVLPQEPKNAKEVVQLYAVDLGFVVSAPAGDLRPLVESLFSLDRFPPTAVRAGLEGVLPVDYRPGSGGEPKWPPTATETLKELVLHDQKIGLEVVASRLNEDGSFAVELIFQSGGGQSQRATQVLKRFKLAKATV